MHISDLHISAINYLYPNAKEVALPCIRGHIRDVYIITNEHDEKFVCRFSNEKTAKHNLNASQLLTKYSIPVPQVTICKYNSQYCEIYPFIKGKTFCERISDGLSKDKFDRIYNQLFDIAYKISQIPVDNTLNISLPLPTRLIKGLFNVLNPESKRQLCHYDMYPSNIVLDDQDNVCGLLDLDSVTAISLRFALFVVMRDAAIRGYYDIQDLEKLSVKLNEPYNKISLDRQMKIFMMQRNVIKFLLSEKIRNQLLKIRIK